MGIKGLLLNTKEIGVNKNISEYKNKKVGIDAYSWLHKALYSSSLEIAFDNNINGLIIYFETRIKHFLSLDIKILLVFDGNDLPLKEDTNLEREENRKKNLELGMKLYKEKDFEQARKKLSSAINVNPDIVFTLKKELQKIFDDKIEFLVAPYEADSQLAYLIRIDYIDIVISEDSDLLVFGAQKIFYKMDNEYNGNEYDLEVLLKDFFDDWDHSKFIKFSILLGCDYLKNPRGIGFKKALQLFKEQNNFFQVLKQIQERVEEDYFQRYLIAFLVFRYSRVYCPIKKRIVFMNNLDLHDIKQNNEFEYFCVLKALELYDDFNFLGNKIDTEKIRLIAECVIHPVTQLKYQDIYMKKENKKLETDVKQLTKTTEQTSDECDMLLFFKFKNESISNNFRNKKLLIEDMTDLNLKGERQFSSDPRDFFIKR